MSRLVTGQRRTPAVTDAQFDAEALAIIRPSWGDRDRYADPAAQLAALRALARRTTGEGSVSRACRRGYHQHCQGGECECNCHIPGAETT